MIEVKTSVNGDTRDTSVKIQGKLTDLLMDTHKILEAIYEAIRKENAEEADAYAYTVKKGVVHMCFEKDISKAVKEVADGLMG